MDLSKLDYAKAALDTGHHLRSGFFAALASARFERLGYAARRDDVEGVGGLAIDGHKGDWISMFVIVSVLYHGMQACFSLARNTLRLLQGSWSFQLNSAIDKGILIEFALFCLDSLRLRARKRESNLLVCGTFPSSVILLCRLKQLLDVASIFFFIDGDCIYVLLILAVLRSICRSETSARLRWLAHLLVSSRLWALD